MKYTALIVVVLFALTNAEDWTPKVPADIKVIRAECLSENPLSDEIIQKMMHLEFPNEENVRKYILCTAKKMGIFCEHQGYHPDRIAKQFKLDLEDDEVLKLAQDCSDKNEQQSPVEEWAYRGHQCLMSSKIGERVREYIKRQQEKAAAEKKQ